QAPAAPAPATLDVTVQPPGASVYLDDELVGTADREWGRLVKSGVAPGRHRVRLALAGHADAVEEVDAAAGQRVELRRRLAPVAAPATRGWLVPSLAAAAVVALALGGWALGRRRGPVTRPPATTVPTFDPDGATPLRTPPAVSADGQGEA